MSYLRGSANYVWCTTSVLGKGATGAVFQGVSKHDGEPVAVKTFNQLSHMRPQEVQVREFEVLKKVKHENIVKLLAIEEEQDGRGKVIVMELCTGGSLFNILDDPENTYGLEEDEFLLVLDNLSAGMKHLRDHNLVHRDLKPGNIMKFVAEDGRVIYKLTDFGAARELEEDQEFVSLYGTEEYLHPDMYERAVLRKPVGKTFSASVDLWSIGVTMFHVATGQLPFRPYGGRKNKEMMYYITTKKESGVICGTQTVENGSVEWKRDLPPACQLSAGLKILVTPLLAGLMEVDPRKRWTFDNFFTSVRNILARKKIHVFYVNRVETLRIYLDLEEHRTLGALGGLVMEQTDISPENQILLYKNETLFSFLDRRSIGEFPTTTEETPLVLCDRENNNVSLDWDSKDLPKFPTFPNLVNVENDASLAKLGTGVGYAYKRRIERIVKGVRMINEAVATIVRVIAGQLEKLSKEVDSVGTLVQGVGQQLGLMANFQRAAGAFVTAIGALRPGDGIKILEGRLETLIEGHDESERDYGSIAAKLIAAEGPIRQLHSRFVQNRVLLNEWEEATSEIKDISRGGIKGNSHVGKLRDSWQHLLRDRATRSLTYNDEQFHILERIKMQEKSKCLAELLSEECQTAIARRSELLSDWYKTAQAAFIQTQILGKDMTSTSDSLIVFLSKLADRVGRFQSDVDSLTGALKSLEGGTEVLPSRQKAPSPSKREFVKTMDKGRKELNAVQEEVWAIVKENADLVNQFQTLALSLLTPQPPMAPPSGLSSIAGQQTQSKSPQRL